MLTIIQHLWYWLSQENNSAAAQGFAAMLNVLVTAVLAILTGWYVILTRRMAKGQEQQVQAIIRNESEAKRAAEHRLIMLVTRLQTAVDQLPYKEADLDILPRLSLWNQRDIDGFQEAVVSVEREGVLLAGEVIDSLSWILTLQQKCKGESTLLRTINMNIYQNKVIIAKSKLSEIAMLSIGSR